MEMPEIIKAIRTTEKGGFWDEEYIQTAYPEHEATYHHSRIKEQDDATIEALHKENEDLKAACKSYHTSLGQRDARIAELEEKLSQTVIHLAARNSEIEKLKASEV